MEETWIEAIHSWEKLLASMTFEKSQKIRRLISKSKRKTLSPNIVNHTENLRRFFNSYRVNPLTPFCPSCCCFGCYRYRRLLLTPWVKIENIEFIIVREKRSQFKNLIVWDLLFKVCSCWELETEWQFWKTLQILTALDLWDFMVKIRKPAKKEKTIYGLRV